MPVLRTTFAAALAALALSTACQRIPPSVSIPGYGEKEEAEEKAESRPLGASEHAPSFFNNESAE